MSRLPGCRRTTSTAFALASAVLALVCLACASSRWEVARAEDSAAAYHRYLREHPDSRYAELARERLAFVRVRQKPTPEAYEAFADEFPSSALQAELRPIVESGFFERARARATPAAYREFLALFPDGRFAARARGNAVYLEAGGWAGEDVAALAGFAASHPESDFAAEAERTVRALDARSRTRISRVALELAIDPATPGAERVRRLFADRAQAQYAQAGIELVPWTPDADVDAVLSIRHREEIVSPEGRAGSFRSSGVVATTEVVLSQRRESGAEGDIWSHTFRFRANAADRRDGESLLFGPAAHRFWSEFFVPVSAWSSDVAVRKPWRFSKPVMAVEVVGTLAVALFGDGDLEFLEIGDPAQPVALGSYRRERDLARFRGLRILDGRAVLYGEDGIEVVALGGPEGPRRIRRLDRGSVGSIAAVEGEGGRLLAAGHRGLLLIEPDDDTPRVLVPGAVRGLARVGEHLLFTDGGSLFVSTLARLLEGEMLSDVHLGRAFEPARIRTSGAEAIVIGERGVIRVDVSQPERPRVLSRVGARDVGDVRDAFTFRGRLFLLGARGLQVADAAGGRVIDSADVDARLRLDATGRHLVLVGGSALQVVDATPFVVSSPPAGVR